MFEFFHFAESVILITILNHRHQRIMTHQTLPPLDIQQTHPVLLEDHLHHRHQEPAILLMPVSHQPLQEAIIVSFICTKDIHSNV